MSERSEIRTKKRRSWSSDDICQLRAMVEAGMSLDDIATSMRRSQIAVSVRANLIGLSVSRNLAKRAAHKRRLR